MCKRRLLLLTAAALGCLRVWGGHADIVPDPLDAGKPVILENKIYHFTHSCELDLTKASGACPLLINGNVTPVLWIDKGVTVTVKGGRGSAPTPGMPGIGFTGEGTSGTLIVVGEGVLNAVGGGAGNGGKGGNPGEPKIEPNYGLQEVDKWPTRFTAGSGGAGGAGGGGGAPGIGGIGGQGAAETQPPPLPRGEHPFPAGYAGVKFKYYCEMSPNQDNGKNDTYGWHLGCTIFGNMPGASGAQGGDGGNCGTIYVLGSGSVVASRSSDVASGGSAGSYPVNPGGAAKSWFRENGPEGKYAYNYFALGYGGPGGGGGSGYCPGYDIGGGAAGGGSGGSGAWGSSVVSLHAHSDTYRNVSGKPFTESCWCFNGLPGGGGVGGNNGEKSADDASSWQDGFSGTYRHAGAGKQDAANSRNVILDKSNEDVNDLNDWYGSHDDFVRGQAWRYWGGEGAKSKGNPGAHGTIYRYDKATLSGTAQEGTPTTVYDADTLDASKYSQLPEAVRYTMELTSEDQIVDAKTIAFGVQLPSRVTIPSPRAGYVFNGYQQNGSLIYNQLGTRVDKHDNLVPGNRVLSAVWASQEDWDPIVVREELELDGEWYKGTAAEPPWTQPPSVPLFDVRPGGKLILKNISVKGQAGHLVSPLCNSGELVVSNCVFELCTARRGRGGVYCDFPGARATFINCTFQCCGALEGGVIAAEASSVSVVSSTFIGNMSITQAPGQPGGAAVMAMDGAEVSVVGCSLVDQVCDELRPGDGRVLAYYGATDGTNGTYVLNNLWQTTESCPISETNGVRSLDWRSNRYTQDSADAGGDTQAPYGWIASNRVYQTRSVPHTLVRPCGALHTAGRSGVLYHNAAWTKFLLGPETAPEGFEQVCDQLARPPAREMSGAYTGNPLQRKIDYTKPGDVVRIAPGVYEPVSVGHPVHIVGEDRAGCVIDAGFEDVCVLWYPSGAATSWENFTFRYGHNAGADGKRICWDANGGGWSASANYPAGVATNCEFTLCSAQDGGGVAYARSIVSSEFVGCAAEGNGGGAYRVPLVDRCHFLKNASQNAAAVYGDENDRRKYVVRASLVELNESNTNAVSVGCSCQFCTIAKNSSGGDRARPLSTHSDFLGCLFTGNTGVTNGTANTFTCCQFPLGSEFVSTKNRDYHLKVYDWKDYAWDYQRRYHLDLLVKDPDLVNSVKNAGWLDLEGNSFVTVDRVLNLPYLYMGCYAYFPFKLSGLTVTGPDDWYTTTNLRTSLREAVQMAAYYSQRISTNLVITFATNLFDSSGCATLRFGESQLELCDITNQTLVIQGPTDRVLSINGNGTNRAARVWAGNDVRFENIAFTNCFGGEYGSGGATFDGGAILNFGRACVSNCVFRNNQGGWKIPKSFGSNIGNGGAIATESGATTTVYAATFEGNVGAKGGAIWTQNGGSTRVFYSTFTGNRADGISSTDVNGGACAMARASYNPKPTELWLTHCLVVSNRVEDKSGSASLGGGIYAAKNGLILLNSVIVGNFVGATTNDIALPDVAMQTSEAVFCHTAYGHRTKPSYSDRIIYHDTSVTNVTDWTKAIGAFTNGVPKLPTPLPHTVVPLADDFKHEATHAWTTDDFGILGYGSRDWPEDTLAGDYVELLFEGHWACVNQLGMVQTNADDVVMLGPTTYTAPAIGGDRPKPKYDDDDQVPESEGVCYLIRIDGTYAYYPTVDKAYKHYYPGDVVGPRGTSAREELVRKFFPEMRDYQKTNNWYRLEYDASGRMALVLTDAAKPTVTGGLDVLHELGLVQAKIGNVKPNLVYSLGHSTQVVGPWKWDLWIGSSGYSDLDLYAPKVGPMGFYRVLVAPYTMPKEEK